MKKIIVIVIALIMVLTLAAGCGNTNSNGANGVAGVISEEETAKGSSEMVLNLGAAIKGNADMLTEYDPEVSLRSGSPDLDSMMSAADF